MEQAPALTMSTPALPTTPDASNWPDRGEIASPDVKDTSSSVIPSSAGSSHVERPTSPTETIRAPKEPREDVVTPRTTVQTAFQHGLDRGNLEQEVGQVRGTFNSWWGGVKKQVSLAAFSANLTDYVVRRRHLEFQGGSGQNNDSGTS